MDAISAFELSKQFGNKTALHNLTLSVPDGGKYALVGLAGCGKTTALRLFAALTMPTFGDCSVFGHSSQYEPEKIHKLIGAVMETSKLYETMTVRENLRFFANLYNLDSYDTVDRISFLLHKLDIWETRDKFIREVSTNVIQRVHLARALIHSPRLLLMDEPIEGMDLETIEVVNGLIQHINTQENVTVLVSTRHFLHAQKFCEHYVVMDAGVIIAEGNIETLRKRCGLFYNAKFNLSSTSALPMDIFFQKEDGSWNIKIKSEEEMPKLISQLVNTKCEMYQAIIEKPTLIDIYEQLCQYGTKGSDFFVSEIQKPRETETSGENGVKDPIDRQERKQVNDIVTEQGQPPEDKGSREENKDMVFSGSQYSAERSDSDVEL